MRIDPENFLDQPLYHINSSNKVARTGCSRAFKVCMRVPEIKMASEAQTAIILWVLGDRDLSRFND